MPTKRSRDDDDDDDGPYDDPWEPTDNPLFRSFGPRQPEFTPAELERGLSDEQRRAKGLDPNDFLPSKPIYSRSRKTYETKDTFTAALQLHFHGQPKPIFRYNEIEPGITNITAFKTKFIDEQWVVPVEEGFLKLHPDLQKCNSTNSFVFINVSKVHAIVFILTVTGELFTVGFGYYGAKNSNVVKKAKTAVSGVSGVAHLVDEINVKHGALYTADYIIPSKDHESKIIWCDVFTDKIKEKLVDTLSHTKTILYNVFQQVDPHSEDKFGNFGPPQFHVTNESILEVDSAYFAAAEFVPLGFNCILWAKYILGGLKLDCGMDGQPFSCKGLTKDQIENFLYRVYETRSTMVELTALIRSLQEDLKPKKSWWTGRGKSRKRKRTKNKRKKRTLKR